MPKLRETSGGLDWRQRLGAGNLDLMSLVNRLSFALMGLALAGACAKGSKLSNDKPAKGGAAGVEEQAGSAGTIDEPGGGESEAGSSAGGAPGNGGAQGRGGAVGRGGATAVGGGCPTEMSGVLVLTNEPSEKGKRAVTRVSAADGQSIDVGTIDVRYCFDTVGEATFDLSKVQVNGGVENLTAEPYYVNLANSPPSIEGTKPYCLVFDLTAGAGAMLTGNGDIRLDWSTPAGWMTGDADMIDYTKPAPITASVDGVVAACELQSYD